MSTRSVYEDKKETSVAGLSLLKQRDQTAKCSPPVMVKGSSFDIKLMFDIALGLYLGVGSTGPPCPT